MGPVQLSILIPSYRAGLLACSRIAQACSWASPEIEVLVRDNSGDAQKRSLLPQFQRENCTIILAEPCDGPTNLAELMRLAKGEFVFALADDDFCFDHAVAALPGIIEQCRDDASVAGITGAYAVESSQSTAIVTYKDIDSPDVATRVAGYLSHSGPNALIYSVIRRDAAQRLFSFFKSMPAAFSFHDQVMCLFYLLNGKFIPLNRLLYLYDHGLWERRDTAQQRDLDHYSAGGLDPAINLLHWFICGFEGAVLVRNAGDLFPASPPALKQAIADAWFAVMFSRFKLDNRTAFESGLAREAEALRAKLLAASGQLSFHSMLAEISVFMALSEPEFALRYANFWSAVIDRRTNAGPAAAVRASA
jgi:hypothetical protein